MHRLDPMIRRLAFAAVVWCCAWPVGSSAADRNASYLAALESIRSDQLQAHVEHLADDALEGREAGSQGGRQAGDYLAGQLEKLPLRGAGPDGGFFQPFEPGYRNVLALVEGGDPDLKHQYVVVGAHYDHIGFGTKRNSRGGVGQIHNGADDNASGTSGLLELAEALTVLTETPKRSILLVFWDAEEKRMLGSRHWVAHPTVPLERVVVLVNVDMIGRLRDERLEVFGTRFGYGWRRLVSRANEGLGLKVDFLWTTKPNGDHSPFLEGGIPALMLHTGIHDDYHRPSDDAALINAEGTCRITRLLFAVTYDLANRSQVPAFRDAGRKEDDSTLRGLLSQKPNSPDRLGIRWEAREPPDEGLELTRVVTGSPADKAGLAPGDRIVEFAGRRIRASDELTWAVTAAENPVEIVIDRPGHEGRLRLTAQLDGHSLRLGIRWRTDDAEPGAVILTDVVPGSPAAAAGLQVGDHVYQIAGRDFADEAEFGELARTLPGPLKLLVERDGQLRTVEIQLQPHSLERAA